MSQGVGPGATKGCPRAPRRGTRATSAGASAASAAPGSACAAAAHAPRRRPRRGARPAAARHTSSAPARRTGFGLFPTLYPYPILTAVHLIAHKHSMLLLPLSQSSLPCAYSCCCCCQRLPPGSAERYGRIAHLMQCMCSMLSPAAGQCSGSCIAPGHVNMCWLIVLAESALGCPQAHKQQEAGAGRPHPLQRGRRLRRPPAARRRGRRRAPPGPRTPPHAGRLRARSFRKGINITTAILLE